jgi:hypothetical protein
MHTLKNILYKTSIIQVRSRAERSNLIKSIELSRDFAQSLASYAKDAAKQRQWIGSIADHVKNASAVAGERVRTLRSALRERAYTRHELHLGDRRYSGIMVAYETQNTRIAPSARLELINELKRKLRSRRAALRKPSVQYKSVGPSEFQLVGGTFSAPGSILTLLKKRKENRLYKPKKPRVNAADSYVGVEIECFVPESIGRERLAEVFLSLNLEDCIEVKSDGSIRPYSGHKGIELTVLARQSEVADVLRRTCEALVILKARVNKSCGLHVHIDMRHRDPSISGERLVKSQALLYKVVPASRRNNSYCKRTKKRADLYGYQCAGRYQAINFVSLDRHNTIEVRLHSGTTDYSKILNWVQLLLTIADTDFSKSPRTIAGWVKGLQLDAAMKRYLLSREAKFKDATDADESTDPELESNEVDCADCGTTIDADDTWTDEGDGNSLCGDCYHDRHSESDEDESAA